MSTLQKFPFDRMKLDKSFVQSQVRDAKAKAILESILMLCRRLDIGIVAEGVETDEQFALLREQGCCEVQGFLTGRPIRRAAMPEFLALRAGAMIEANRVDPAPYRGARSGRRESSPAVSYAAASFS